MEAVKKLNRLSRLYDYSIHYAKPYRIGKIRDMYQMAFKQINLEYSIDEFGCNNYQEVFDTDEKLELARLKKQELVSEYKYEEAAFYRDKEKTILRSLLLAIGVDEQDKFFHWNNKVYKIV